jgi:hypothetical protein
MGEELADVCLREMGREKEELGTMDGTPILRMT